MGLAAAVNGPDRRSYVVTGAHGFIGRRLMARLVASGADARALIHQTASEVPGAAGVMKVDLGTDFDARSFLAGTEVVIHTAGLAHGGGLSEPGLLRRVNVDGPVLLARQAAEAGVRRFVFLSTAKVHGEETRPGRPFCADDAPTPGDLYARSKHEAEQQLTAVSREAGIDIVVVRPALVYGPGVKANFLMMMRWLQSGIPLPLASIENRRSFVALDNLVDALMACAAHPAAANSAFLVSDGEDLSTPELMRRVAAAMGIRARLIPAPVAWLRAAGRLTGRSGIIRRLVESFEVDITHTRTRLGWTPPLTVDEGLVKAVGTAS